jgi:hypothetical protein
MKAISFRPSAPFVLLIAVFTTLLLLPLLSLAQNMSSTAEQASAALTGDQRASANSALCSAIGGQVANPSTASPSLLSSPKVISAAAPLFASRVHLPLPGATSLLEKYVAQHATDILASCAMSNATGGLTSKIPGGSNMPSVPNVP